MGYFGAFAGGFGQGFLNGYKTRLQAMYYYNMVQYYNYIMRMNNYNPETKTFWDFSGKNGGGWTSPTYQSADTAGKQEAFDKGYERAPKSKEGPAPAVSGLSSELYTWSGKGYTSITPDASYTSPALVGEDKNAFWTATLNKLGAPVTQSNIDFLNGWSKSEGTKAALNPLATTMGHSAGDFNSQGVQNFKSLEEGANFTARTIANGRYPSILKTLQGGDASGYGTKREQGDTQAGEVGNLRSKPYASEDAARKGGHLRITGDDRYTYPAPGEHVAPERPIHGGGTHQLDANGQPIPPTIDSSSALNLAAIEAASATPQQRPQPGQTDPYWSKNHPIARPVTPTPSSAGPEYAKQGIEDPSIVARQKQQLVDRPTPPAIAPGTPDTHGKDAAAEAMRNMQMMRPPEGGDEGSSQQMPPVQHADVGMPPGPLPMVSGEFSPYAPGYGGPSRYEPQQISMNMDQQGQQGYARGGVVTRFDAGGGIPSRSGFKFAAAGAVPYSPSNQFNEMSYVLGQTGVPYAGSASLTGGQYASDWSALTPAQQNYASQMNTLSTLASQAGNPTYEYSNSGYRGGQQQTGMTQPNFALQQSYYDEMNNLTAPPSAQAAATPAATTTTPAATDTSNVQTNVSNATTALEGLNSQEQSTVTAWQNMMAQQEAANQQQATQMADWYANLQASNKASTPATNIPSTNTTTPQFGYGYGYTGTGTTANTTGRPSSTPSSTGTYGAGGYSDTGQYGVSTNQDILNAPNVVGFEDGGDVSPSVLGPPPGLAGGMGGGQQIPPYYFNPQTYPPLAAPVGKGVSTTSAPTVMKAAPVPTFGKGGALFRYADAGPVDDTPTSTTDSWGGANIGGPSTGLPPQVSLIQDTSQQPQQQPFQPEQVASNTYRAPTQNVGGMGMRGPSMRRPPMSVHPPQQKGPREPDIDVDETQHHDWGGNKPQNAPIEAPMIQDQNGNPSKGVTDALATGLHLIGGLLGLGPSNAGGIPTDPSVQDNRREFAAGVGTPSHEQMDTIQDRVDPMHALGESQRFMAGLEAVYKYDMLVMRDPEAAQRDAAVMLMYARDMAAHYGKEAVGYYYHGDMDKMLEALNHANNYAINGTNMYGTDNKDGTIHVEARDLANNLMWQQEVVPATILGAALKIADGSLYWQQLEQTAAKYDPVSANMVQQRQAQAQEQQVEQGLKGFDSSQQPAPQRQPFQPPSPYKQPISPRIQAGGGDAGAGAGGGAAPPVQGLQGGVTSPLVNQFANAAQPSPDSQGAINQPMQPPTSDSQLKAGIPPPGSLEAIRTTQAQAQADMPTPQSQEISQSEPLSVDQEAGKVADIQRQTASEFFTDNNEPIVAGQVISRPPPLETILKGVVDPKARNYLRQVYDEKVKEYNTQWQQNRGLMEDALKGRTEDWRTSITQARTDKAAQVKQAEDERKEQVKQADEERKEKAKVMHDAQAPDFGAARKIFAGDPDTGAVGKHPREFLLDASGMKNEDYSTTFRDGSDKTMDTALYDIQGFNKNSRTDSLAGFVYGFASNKYPKVDIDPTPMQDEWGPRYMVSFTRPDGSRGHVVVPEDDMQNLINIHDLRAKEGGEKKEGGESKEGGGGAEKKGMPSITMPSMPRIGPLGIPQNPRDKPFQLPSGPLPGTVQGQQIPPEYRKMFPELSQ